ncbi:MULTISPECIES: ASCH domain-containing protein [Streptomyces]|uniref:hypothetical protein n=1 Tax=Streptomyces TaxID=1883 RepID=UPI00211D2387|nr:hypothetical protein [Streptomyces sp. st115]
MPDDTQQASPAVPSPAAGDEPHEHHIQLLGRYYRQVEAGRKTVEVMVAAPKKRAVAVGDTVVFRDRDTGRELDVVVQRITPYRSFDDLISSENLARIDPSGRPESCSPSSAACTRRTGKPSAFSLSRSITAPHGPAAPCR